MSLRQRHLQVVGRLLSSITPNPATYPSLSGLDWLCLSLSAHRHYSTLAETLGCPDQYHKVGQIKERLFPERKPIFAVVEVGPTQFKVSADDLIYAEKLSGVDVNDRISLNRVLMLGSHAETVIGRPYVPDASVIAAIEEQTLDAKVIIFHKRRRKNSKKTKGHRQPLTGLRILNIHGLDEQEDSAEDRIAA